MQAGAEHLTDVLHDSSKAGEHFIQCVHSNNMSVTWLSLQAMLKDSVKADNGFGHAFSFLTC